MRRLVLCLVLAFTAVPALAQSTPAAPGGPARRVILAAPAQQEDGGRSGFWTSRRPAKGGAYRYRLMGIGLVLVTATGFIMLHLIKKAKAERDQNNRK